MPSVPNIQVLQDGGIADKQLTPMMPSVHSGNKYVCRSVSGNTGLAHLQDEAASESSQARGWCLSYQLRLMCADEKCQWYKTAQGVTA